MNCEYYNRFTQRCKLKIDVSSEDIRDIVYDENEQIRFCMNYGDNDKCLTYKKVKQMIDEFLI